MRHVMRQRCQRTKTLGSGAAPTPNAWHCPAAGMLARRRRAAGRLPPGRCRAAAAAAAASVQSSPPHLLLAEPRVDDVVDAVDGERRLRDVGGNHDLARAGGRGLEDPGLRAAGAACGGVA